MIKSKDLRNSARGQECTLRLVNVCNWNPETVVLAHIGRDRGMGIKCNDTFAVFACSACHAEIDGPNRFKHEADKLRALESTQDYWIRNGFIKV